MTTLTLGLAFNRAVVLMEQAIDVTVTLKNTGTAVAVVHSPDDPSEFEFIVRPERAPSAARVLSARRSDLARSGDPIPKLPVDMASLLPGQELSYPEDLAQYAVPQLEPGRYAVAVAYRLGNDRFVSSEIALEVTVPQVRAMAVAVAPVEQRLTTVFVAQAAKDVSTLLQRESNPQDPVDGVAYARRNLRAPVSAVATAVELQRHQGGRWYAWLEQDALGGGVAQFKSAFAAHDPVPLGLQHTVLHPVGWQAAADRFTALALGTAPGGGVAIAIADMFYKQPANIQLQALAVKTIPGFWRANFGDNRFEMVYAEQGNNAARIFRQSIVKGADSASDPKPLFEYSGTVLALALNPLRLNNESVADILFRSTTPATIELVRLRVNDGAVISRWVLAVPRDDRGQFPDAWALAATALPNPAILTKLGDRLLERRVDGNGVWTPLATDSTAAGNLHLVVISDRDTWAVWSDPARGIQYRRVP